MNIRRSKLLILLLLPLAVACSEKEVLEDKTKSQGQDVPSTPVKLVIETDAVLDMIFEEQSSILAKVMFEDNTPAADRAVRFTILGNGEGSELLFNEGTTGTDGRIANPLKAGEIRTSFKVRVETTQNTGEELFEIVNVTVDGVYKGDLKVTFTYDEVLPLSSISTNIHEGPFNCDNIDFNNLPPVAQTEEAASVGDSVLFRRLPENEIYTITASGVGPAGNVIALGCQISEPIVGRGVVTAVVALELKPVEFEGVFDFSTQLHLNEAIPGPAGDILVEVETYFTQPSATISAFLEEEFMNAAGVSIPADIIAALLDNYVFDQLPGWANEGLNIVGDTTGLLNHLTVGGKLNILSADEEGNLTGEWGWNDFMFRWALAGGCDPTNACCGRRVYTGEEVGLEPVAAEFVGNVTRQARVEGEPAPTTLNYDFTMDEHRLNLQYGNIILFVLNEFVLPATTGQDSIACAVESLMGCNDPADEFVCGGTNVGVCGCERAGEWLADLVGNFTTAVTPQMASGICEVAMTAAGTAIENQLLGLGYAGTEEAGLSMQAIGTFSDLDRNLQADQIKADTNGIIYVGDAGQTEFTGDMLAGIERLACEADSACASGSTCSVVQDTLNECTGTQACMPSAGERIGGVRCTGDAQCESGICLKNETCFQACTEDADCTGDLVCGVDAFEVALSDDITVTVTACGQIE